MYCISAREVPLGLRSVDNKGALGLRSVGKGPLGLFSVGKGPLGLRSVMEGPLGLRPCHVP